MTASLGLYHVLKAGFPADMTQPVIRLCNGETISYQEMETEVCRYAAVFRSAGLAPGDRIAVQVDKSPQALFVYLACVQAGFVYLPMNVAYRDAEVGHILADARPSALVCRGMDEEARSEVARQGGVAHVFTLNDDDTGTLPAASETVSSTVSVTERGGSDLAALLYTSGTTGKPKGVMLSHDNLISNAQVLVDAWGWRHDDVLVHALPLFHTHGLFVACHCVLLGGSSMIFMPKFDTETIIDSLPQASVMMGVPTFYTRLLGCEKFNSSVCRNMRLFVSGSAPLLESTFSEFVERTGHTILERYGMTETGMNTSNPLEGTRIAGTVGFPLPGVEVRIVDDQGLAVQNPEIVGNVQVCGPNVFVGYWDQPEKTASEFTDDGYFMTGDLGRFSSAGYLCLVGRSKDLIISGGFNVYPKEVELLIDQMAEVSESAVIGLPDPDLGEAVTAVVVLESGAELSAAAVIAALKSELAGYKVPKRVVFQSSLPRNAMGKVQKNLLREALGSV